MSKIQRRLTRGKSLIQIDPDHEIQRSGSLKRIPKPVLSFEDRSMTFMENSIQSNRTLNLGPSPCPENLAFEYDSVTTNGTVSYVQPVNANTIRQNILNQMKSLGGNFCMKLLDDIESGKFVEENCGASFSKLSIIEKNITLLWCVLMRKPEFCKPLTDLGAHIKFCDENGYTPLHLSAFSGCSISTNFFLSKGANPNEYTKVMTPLHFAVYGNSRDTARLLINNGALVNDNYRLVDETLLQCAVRCNAVDCLEVFISESANVNQFSMNGTNAIHLAADLGNEKCLKILLDSPNADPNMKTTGGKSLTALHYAAEEGSKECVRLLLQKKANANVQDYRGFTPLHMAAKSASVEVVEMLLRIGGADIRAVDNDMRSVLHAAIGKNESNLDVIEILNFWRVDINAKDKYGFSPLHLAALDGLTDCVEFLILLGANVTTTSEKGITALNVISRKTPAALNTIMKKLDESISISHTPGHCYQEVEMKMDFRNIVAHCHPYETECLKTFLEEGKKMILEHPLCQAFLHLKWQKLKKFQVVKILFYTLKLFLFGSFVLTAFARDCKHIHKTNETNVWIICSSDSSFGGALKQEFIRFDVHVWILCLIISFEIYTKIYNFIGYKSVRSYFAEIENVTEWLENILICVTIFLENHHKHDHDDDTVKEHDELQAEQFFLGAFSIIICCFNLMFLIGKLPEFGAQIEMFNKIFYEFFKLFATFSCILLGFVIGFAMIFPEAPLFANPFLGFISVLVMMVGELNTDLLTADNNKNHMLFQIGAQGTFLVFLFLITIVLMNLLIGIAVNDIQALRKNAELSKLVRQTKLIYHMEKAMIYEWFPYWPKVFAVWLRTIIRKSILVSPKGYRYVINVRPLNLSEKRLPTEILNAAYKISMQNYNLERVDDDEDETCANNEKDVAEQLKDIQQEIEELKKMFIHHFQNNKKDLI